MSVNKRKYNTILDILRIISTCMVFSVHLIQNISFEGNKITELIDKICRKGANGVPILFCLSGYLIWSGFQKDNFKYSYYIKRRLQKLVPAYWCILVIYMVVGLLPLSLGVVRYFTFTNAIIPSSNFNIYNNMSGFWSMSSFMLFYLLAPIMNGYIRNSRQAFNAMVICFTFGKLFDFALEYFLISVGADEVGFMMASFPIGNMYFFMVGGIAFWLIGEKKELWGILGAICGVAILIGINKLDYPLWTLLAFIIILISENVEEGCSFKILTDSVRYLSLISYEIYLIHFLIIKLNMTAQICERYGVAMFVMCTIIETLIASIVLHFLIDYFFKKIIIPVKGRI